MIAGTLTFTGKIGPGNTLTTHVFSNVSFIAIDLRAITLTVTWSDGQGEHITTLDFDSIATLTASLVAAVSTSLTFS